jgi:cytochrome b subunit of formate dehydrogenase
MIDSEIKRYSKIVVFQHWLLIIMVLVLSITGIFLLRDWFVHEFHIHGAENYIPTPEFTLDIHKYTAFGLLGLGAIHLAVHVGQKEKPLLPKNSYDELKNALYSLMFLVFLTKKQERGSGKKYLKSQRIIYAFTIYVLGLAAITGFLYFAGILTVHMEIAHIVAGVLVVLIVIHHLALLVRKHDKVAIRCVLSTGTMPEWYVKKNHRAWYEELVGRSSSEYKEPKEKKPALELEETEEPKSKEKKTEEKPAPPAPSETA